MKKNIDDVIKKWDGTCLLKETYGNDKIELAMILEYCDVGKLEYKLDMRLIKRLRNVYDFIEFVKIIEKDATLE